MDRRTFLAAGVIAATGGCLGSDVTATEPRFEQAQDAWSNDQQETGLNSVARSASLELEEGQWAVHSVTPDRSIELSYRLDIQGTDVAEVYLMDRREFDRFREGESITHHQGFYSSGTLPRASGVLSSGDYMIAIENTAYGELPPDGPIEATWEVEARA